MESDSVSKPNTGSDDSSRWAALEAARAELAHADPVMRRLIESQPDLDPRAWLSTLPAFDAFGTLLWQVLGQQISVAAARAILGRLQSAFGRVPTPAQVLDADPAVLLNARLSRRKLKTLKAIAEGFAAGSIRSDELATMSDAEVETRLTSINGVGPWTVHGFLIIALDRPDVVLPGDVALRRAIQREYELKERPSQDEVRALADRWRPNRTLASAYLFAASSKLARSRTKSPKPPRRVADESGGAPRSITRTSALRLTAPS
jgi:DNA-3-methyladenine glycosylase II